MGLADFVHNAKDAVEDAAKVVVDKAHDAASVVADKTGDTVEVVRDKTHEATAYTAEKVDEARPHVEAGAFNAKAKARVESEVLRDKVGGEASVVAAKGACWFEKAKDKVGGAVSDEHLDRVADKIKGITPDAVDRVVDKATDAAKRIN